MARKERRKNNEGNIGYDDNLKRKLLCGCKLNFASTRCYGNIMELIILGDCEPV